MNHNPKNITEHERNPGGLYDFGNDGIYAESKCSCGAKFLTPAYIVAWFSPKKGEKCYQPDPDEWQPWDEIIKKMGKEPKQLL